MADKKKAIYADDLFQVLRDDININGSNLARVRRHIEAAPAVDAVVLPCKIGDSVWCVYSPPRPANPADKGKWYMGEFEVARFHYGVKGLSMEMYGFGTVAVKEIGKTVFLTKEEAKAALAKMDGRGADNG